MPQADEFEPAHPPSRNPPGLPWPQSSGEAGERYAAWKEADPFPEVAAALLNAADIERYVLATGLIYPFYPDQRKAASYPLALGGDVVYWDRHRRKRTVELGKDARRTFTLRPNSIAYVTLEPVLRLPEYIALRFNLKIDFVYRGLLLGTGPLVDPGWSGRLTFPLHNLTTNDYPLRAGDEIIWVEFTKVSHNERWLSRAAAPGNRWRHPELRGGAYDPKPVTTGGTVHSRLENAAPNLSIRSSLDEAYERADSAAKLTNRIQVWGATALLIGLATIVALAVDVLRTPSSVAPTRTVTVVAHGTGGPAELAKLQREFMRLQQRFNRRFGK